MKNFNNFKCPPPIANFINKHKFHEFEINKSMTIDDIFLNVTNVWTNLYKCKSVDKFTLIINTTNFPSNVPISQVYKMVTFINDIKKKRKNDPSYKKLESTVLMIEDGSLRLLLKMVFSLTKPLSNVYLASSVSDMNYVVECLKKNEKVISKNVKIFRP